MSVVLLFSCNKDKQNENTDFEVFEASQNTDSILMETHEDTTIASSTIPSTKTPQITSWNEVVKKIGKQYKVVGIWKANDRYTRHIIIYSKSGRYYMNNCQLSNKPFDDDNALLLRKKGSKKFIYTEEGNDMPEQYVINNNTLNTYVYNPDVPSGGEWVWMGDYTKVY